MSSSTAGWFGTAVGGRGVTDVHGQPEPLASPQYGPAHVADVMGTTHEQRVQALVEAEWTILADDRDSVAVAYSRLLASKIEEAQS